MILNILVTVGVSLYHCCVGHSQCGRLDFSVSPLNIQQVEN